MKTKKKLSDRLLVQADLWPKVVLTIGRRQFPNLEACREHAAELGYDGIYIRFDTIKWQTRQLIRNLRRTDKKLMEAGLKRRDIARSRKAERRNKRE